MVDRRFVCRKLSDITTTVTSHNIGLKQVLLAKNETSSAITQIAVTTLRGGEFVEEHVHETMDEHFIFQSGRGWMFVDGEQIKCTDGVFLLIPAGTPHSMRSDEDLRFVTIGVAL